jgi:hypothetical protein
MRDLGPYHPNSLNPYAQISHDSLGQPNKSSLNQIFYYFSLYLENFYEIQINHATKSYYLMFRY